MQTHTHTHTHTQWSYYLAMERNEALICTKTWISTLKNLMFTERSRTQEPTYYRILLKWNTRLGKSREPESSVMFAGKGVMEVAA